ncbi:MAG TPA: metallophosphoesterase family protein [Gaiellaceae bacterium]|nr:metallophosphoesterase family protein [Gaiellaceae bacterium]
MRVAVVSDIHGNLHALEAVLDAASVDEIWCLGDVVGYGARPNECCELVRARAAVCLAGNHDLVVVGTLGLDEFSHDAADAAGWSREHLTEQNRAWLAGLPSLVERDGTLLAHASPRDPVWEYVLSNDVALASLRATEDPLVLVGHSHVALDLRLADGELSGGVAPAGTQVDLDSGRWLLNPGSVGQPRDGDPRAAWLLVDFGARRATFERVEYDIAATQVEILEAGLPELLALRLASGA